MVVHDSGKKKKADVKVVESVTRISDEEVRKIIDEKIAAKESMLVIKVFLVEEKNIEEERVNNIMIDFVKQKQQKMVDELKKKNAFVLDMTYEERAKIEEAKKGTPTAKGGAAPAKGGAPAGKKDEGKKKK
jgi:hypothetical protein